MCDEHRRHEHEHGWREDGPRGYGFGFGGGPRRGHGPRGLGRRPFPTREEWVERLEAHREQLERELANVRDLLDRLRDAPAPEHP
jgi:hypothetical protein